MVSFVRLQLIMFSILIAACSLVEASPAAEKTIENATGVLFGQFMKDRKTPLANARLYIYDKAMGSPSAERHVRVPDVLDSADKDGKFFLKLAPGTYYITARIVPASGAFGPPAEGEKVYYKTDSRSEILPFIVSAGKRTNAGKISTFVLRKGAEDSGTSIAGTVIDATGTPVEGAIIYAYNVPEVLDKALYVSVRTIKDGKFLLRVKDGGTYYLRVRGEYGGGTPRDGEIVNITDPKELVPVTVGKGERLTDVTIRSKRLEPKGMLYKGPK
jgi:hypothetical protein